MFWRRKPEDSPRVGLEIPPHMFDEIARRLRESGMSHSYVEGALDLEGIVLVRHEEEQVKREHKPIAAKRGTAPGAIA